MIARTASCPRCGGKALLDAANPWRPFCSERCRLIDLGKWANQEYGIPAAEQPHDAVPEDGEPKPH